MKMKDENNIVIPFPPVLPHSTSVLVIFLLLISFL